MKSPQVSAVEFIVRLAIAAVLGVVIGFERQWRQRGNSQSFCQ